MAEDGVVHPVALDSGGDFKLDGLSQQDLALIVAASVGLNVEVERVG